MKQFDLGAVEIRHRNRLPHWHSTTAVYFVTWNLKDAIPDKARIALQREYDYEIRRLTATRGNVSAADRARIQLVIRRRVELLLDRNHGECILGNGDCARIVADSLQHFDGDRYVLFSWSVMPNHVHVVFSCREGFTVDGIIGAWKGYTSKEINRVLNREGMVWQENYYDRCVRDERQFRRTLAYVVNNPSKAGMSEWPFVRDYPERSAAIV
jgi:REP element-mobilizing transposase RayT